MEFILRCADRADATAGRRLPDPPTHVQMMIDALHRELSMERLRQEVIAAELAKQRELEVKARHELGLVCASTLMQIHAGLQSIKFPHNGMAPVPQGGTPSVPLLPGLCLQEAMMTSAATRSSVSRLSVKDRNKERHRPPWHDRSTDKEGAFHTSFDAARQPIKRHSGLKRKRTTENSAANNQKSFEKSSCALCKVNTTTEFSLKEHYAGHRHQSAALESRKETTGLQREATTVSFPGIQHKPTTWNCSICQAKCSCKSNFKNHVRSKMHQENVVALQGDGDEIEVKSGFQEPELSEKKKPRLAEKSQKPASRWNCVSCRVSCTSESDLENHLQGRRHQKNVANA